HFSARSARFAQRDVLRHALVKDNHFLAYQREEPAQIMESDFTQVGAVDGDGARGRIVETEEQIDERALTGTAGAGHTNPRAARNAETEVPQDRAIGPIGEADVVKPDLRPELCEGPRLRRLFDAGLLAENFRQPLYARAGLLEEDVYAGQFLDGQK